MNKINKALSIPKSRVILSLQYKKEIEERIKILRKIMRKARRIGL